MSAWGPARLGKLIHTVIHRRWGMLIREQGSSVVGKRGHCSKNETDRNALIFFFALVLSWQALYNPINNGGMPFGLHAYRVGGRPMTLLLLLFVMLMPGAAAAQEGAKTSAVVKGDVLYWEGEELVVKEITGREVRLHVNSDTKIENVVSKLKTGDKIEAAVNSDGHASSIKLQLPDSGSGTTAPGLR